MSSNRPLDPDALAALEVERDFLLSSLRDLERERDAGDLDDADYVALTDDYTRRAAEVLRSIETREAALAAVPKRPRRQVLYWVVGLLVVGAVAGVLVARSSGSRSPGGSISGVDVSTSREKLAVAQTFMSDAERWDDAIALYDEVLDEQPANAEALTYKGWLTYRSGDDDTGTALLEEAAAADPEYPDARVFLAIVYRDAGDYAAASEQLAAFDTLDAPPMLGQLIDGQGLRDELNGRRFVEELAGRGSSPPTLDELGVSATHAVAAGNWLLSSDASELPDERAQVAAQLFDIVLAAEPDNVDALVSKGWLLGITGLQADAGDIFARGIELLDEALSIDPEFAEAYLLKAELLAPVDPDAALATLDELEQLPDLPDAALAQAVDLRSAIE
ncbi:MAG: tetratricopeptide repeat protein [Acidimicrobiales bacterium]|nr:tetratricopeptide repeat protein [Acidimicrobiales bacterium]